MAFSLLESPLYIKKRLIIENDAFLCSIKIAHGKKSKQEVVAHSVQKTEQEFKKRGLVWPPQKKSRAFRFSFKRNRGNQTLV